jgi:hypothetical protein
LRLLLFIRKLFIALLYLLIVYFLLPFNPGYVYHIAQYEPAYILNEIKKEGAIQDNNTSPLSKSLSQSDTVFHLKDRVRFYFKTGFILAPLLSANFAFSSKDHIRTFSLPSYQPPLVTFISNRGPPIV